MSTVEGDVREVSLEEGLHGDIDQAGGDSAQPRPRPPADSEPPQAKPQAPTDEERRVAEQREAQSAADLEMLAPKHQAVQRTIGVGDLSRSYVQQELSVIGKAQWFSLVGEILKKAMKGGDNDALSLNSLLSPPQSRSGQLGIQDFQDADTFVKAVSELMVHMPEFLEKSVCIWLSVPDYEWDIVQSLMRMSPVEGGMGDKEFEDIFATFIDQNYASIDSFFRERFPRLRARYQARAKEANPSRS